MRFWQLGTLPPGYHYDEAYEGLEAWRLLTDPGYRPIVFSGNFGVEPLFIYLTAVAFRLFGADPVVQRGVAALIGTLTVPAVWLLAHELRQWDRRLPPSFPLWAAVVQAILFWTIHASRIGYEPGLVPLLLCPLLWALLKAQRTARPMWWALAGVMCGLGVYTYPAGRLFPAVVVAVLVVTWVWPRFITPPTAASAQVGPGRRRGWQGPLLLAILAVIVATPMILAWVQNSEMLLLRSRQIAVVAEGAGSTTPLQTALHNTVATLGMFSLAGDVDPRNNLPGRPVFDPFLGLFFYLGLGLTLWRGRRLPYPWLLAVLAVMLVPTILSDYAPHFRRALGAAPMAALLTAIGLTALWERATAAWSSRGATNPLKNWGFYAGAVVLLAVGLSTGLAVRDYFDRWANSPDLFYAFDEGLWRLAAQVDTQPPLTPTYLTPRPVTHTTLAFAWRNGAPPVSFDGRSIFVAPAAPSQPVTYAVIDHEDFRTPLLLPEVFPQATIAEQILDRTGQVYATVYRVPAGSAPAMQPATVSGATWAERVRLRGYTLLSTQQEDGRSVYLPGNFIPVRLYWQPLATIDGDWTFFAHLLSPDGHLLSGRDQPPGNGSYPTSRWQVDDWIMDEVQLPLPADLAAGDYLIEIGFYRADETRLPVASAGVTADRLLIGPVRIAGAP